MIPSSQRSDGPGFGAPAGTATALASSIARDRRLWIAAALLLAAGWLRVQVIPESRFLGERQYRSALLARVDYLAGDADAEGWEREIAQVSAERMGRLEPPIMEWLTVRGYRILGYERPAIARALAAVLWLVGGVFLYLLVGRVVDPASANYSLAYFLFLPLGVLVSTSFIPDALMLALFLAGLLGLVSHEDSPSVARLLWAAAACSACVLVKPLCLFPLAAVWMTLRWSRAGLSGLLRTDWWAVMGLMLLPTLAYYLYGILIGGFLSRQAAVSFVPGLLLLPTFWRDTAGTALLAFGAVPVALALIGACLPEAARARPLLLGLALGYLANIFAFPFLVRITGHYHLPFAVAVSLALAPAVGRLVEAGRRGGLPRTVRWTLLSASVAVVAVTGHRSVRVVVEQIGPIVSRSAAEAVGEIVGHSSRVVYVSQYYGAPLEYLGRLSGWYWPRPVEEVDRSLLLDRPRSIEERLSSLRTSMSQAEQDFRPEYFVVTDFQEFAFHPDLEAFLDERCALLAEDPGYLVFGQCDLEP